MQSVHLLDWKHWRLSKNMLFRVCMYMKVNLVRGTPFPPFEHLLYLFFREVCNKPCIEDVKGNPFRTFLVMWDGLGAPLWGGCVPVHCSNNQLQYNSVWFQKKKRDTAPDWRLYPTKLFNLVGRYWSWPLHRTCGWFECGVRLGCVNLTISWTWTLVCFDRFEALSYFLLHALASWAVPDRCRDKAVGDL